MRSTPQGVPINKHPAKCNWNRRHRIYKQLIEKSTMSNFNKVILLGNLTRDPELQQTTNGQAAVRLGIAINRAWRSERGESRSEVTFVDIDAYGQQAETLCKYLRKGNPLLVEGRLRLHTWVDEDTGAKQTKLRVDLERFSFVGGGHKQRTAATEDGTTAEPLFSGIQETSVVQPAHRTET
jgi:single-strand DNA-binding protein